MASSRLLQHALVAAVVAFGFAQACTIASPTHITVQPTKTTNGTDPSKGDDDDATSPSGGDAVTCSATDFTAPDLSKLTACGNGAGHCFDRDKTPMADQLVACSDASKVCVPDNILQANGGKLASCSVQVLGGKPGGCVTASLYPTIIQQGGSALKQDTCDDGDLCVPCTDPTNNNAPSGFCEPTGVHASACGAAAASPDASAPKATEYCCTTDGNSNGVCIDKSAIPDDQLSKTIRDTCHGANDKCVPKAMVDNNPVTCNSGIAGKGVCMDKCFSAMMGTAASVGVLKQDVCGDTEVCVPCLYAGKQTPGCN
jgi:hypothetical protein